MAFLNYTDPVPTPVPLGAAAPLASYTDPTGDVWVAKGGVNSGQWRRARDVLKSRVFRNAAFNLPTAANTVMVYDAANKDDYGLYTVANGTINFLATGWYRIHAQIQCGTQAAGSFLQISIVVAGTTFAQDTFYVYGTGVFQTARVNDLLYFPAGQTGTIQVRASTAAASTVGNLTDYATFEYVGTG